jgi:chromosome segregation ATPase
MMAHSSGKYFLMIIVLAGSAISTSAIAADKKDKSAHRMQQMVQKIQQEKAELQTQVEQEKEAKAGLEVEVKKTEQQASALKSNLSVANRKAGLLAASLTQATSEKLAVETKLQQTQSQLESAQKNLSDLTLQYQTAQHALKVNEQERTALTGSLTQKGKVLESCEAKNTKLYGFGLELVKLYDKPGTYQAILRTETFTQLKRVELENIFQDYNDKLDEQRLSYSQK